MIFSVRRTGIRIGSVYIRLSRRNLASWGFEAVRIGGLSLWSRTSGGDRMLAAYHPRSSTTWIWSATIMPAVNMFSRTAIYGEAKLHYEGNPHAEMPTWRRWFRRRDVQRRGQWHDYYRMPFGRMLAIARQDYHVGQREGDQKRRRLYAKFNLGQEPKP